MAHFFIEFRLHGYSKSSAKKLIYSVAKKFKVKGVTNKKVVPHIALYGPGETGDIRKVISAIEKIGHKYTMVPFRIKGFGFFNKPKKVIYLDMDPSQPLEELRWELSQELRKISSCQPWDTERNYAFHATIAFRDIDNKFNQIWSFIKEKEKPDINQYLLRITVIGARRRIVCEYDLILKRLLSREQALSKYWWQRTINKLRELEELSLKSEPSSTNWFQRIFGRIG